MSTDTIGQNKVTIILNAGDGNYSRRRSGRRGDGMTTDDGDTHDNQTEIMEGGAELAVATMTTTMVMVLAAAAATMMTNANAVGGLATT
jgi:hypothetical protein